MTDMDARIDRAARAIYAAENGIDGDSIGTIIHENFRIEPDGDDKGLPATMAVCRLAAEAALKAADPELFSSPPSMWLAPWEATKEMREQGAHGAARSRFVRGYNLMRDAYLNSQKDGGVDRGAHADRT